MHSDIGAYNHNCPQLHTNNTNFLNCRVHKRNGLETTPFKGLFPSKFKCKKPHSNYIGSKLIDFNLLIVISKHNNLNTIKLLTFYCTH
jgi:hypothetical protein